MNNEFFKKKIARSKTAKNWIEFAKETIKGDGVEVGSDLYYEFGYKIVQVVKHFGGMENDLWKSTTKPFGTEDRIWVRAYFATKGVSEYSDILTSLDKSVAKTAISQMEVALIKSL